MDNIRLIKYGLYNVLKANGEAVVTKSFIDWGEWCQKKCLPLCSEARNIKKKENNMNIVILEYYFKIIYFNSWYIDDMKEIKHESFYKNMDSGIEHKDMDIVMYYRKSISWSI